MRDPFNPGRAQERLESPHDHYRPGSARHSVLSDEPVPNFGYHRRTSYRQRGTDDGYHGGFNDGYEEEFDDGYDERSDDGDEEEFDDGHDEGFDDRYAAHPSYFAQGTFATSRRRQQECGYSSSRPDFPWMTETGRTHESRSSHDASGGRSPEFTRTQSRANQGDGLYQECEGITRSRRMYVFY